MTNQALPGRPPVHDLSAFDLSKRSPEQVARLFAHWKAQRKRQAEAGPARAAPLPNLKPAVAETGEAAPGETRRASARQSSAPRYSAPFSDLLAAGSEPTVQRTEWQPVAALRPPQPTASPAHRLKVMSILAGAASVLTLAGGALLELADWRNPAQVAPPVTQVRPQQISAVESLATAPSSAPETEWTLRRTVDLALMKAPPPATTEPPTPTIQTVSKAVSAGTGDKPVLPERKNTAPEPAQFVAKPYVPNGVPTPARVSAAPAAAPVPAPVAAKIHAGDPRPDDLFQHGRDNRNGAVSNRTVNDRSASSGKPAAATGTRSAVDARSASVRKGTSGGSVDPRGEGSGGARVGVDGGVGTARDASGDVGAGKGGAGDAGDVSGDGGTSGGNSSAGTADGSDTAGAGPGDGVGDTGAGEGGAAGAGAGDSGTEDTGTGGGDTGSGESGDAGDGGSDAGEDGESGGIGGAIGGALGAVGDALGDALGGGKGNPDSNDKDQRN